MPYKSKSLVKIQTHRVTLLNDPLETEPTVDDHIATTSEVPESKHLSTYEYDPFEATDLVGSTMTISIHLISF